MGQLRPGQLRPGTWSEENDENCRFVYFQYSHKSLEN